MQDKWKEIRIDCKPRYAIIIESLLKEKGIAVVLEDETNATIKAVSFGENDFRRKFYIKELDLDKAQAIIDQFFQDLESAQDSEFDLKEYANYENPMNRVEDQEAKQQMDPNIFKAFIFGVILLIFYFLMNFRGRT